MKMSDVKCDVTFVDYVAEAVKEHDRLTSENARLREMLEFVIENSEPHSCFNFDEAKQLLTELEKVQ